MLTHPETVCSLSAFDYRQRLNEAAKDRIAASAQSGERSPSFVPAAALRAIAAWFGELAARPRSDSRVRLPHPHATS